MIKLSINGQTKTFGGSVSAALNHHMSWIKQCLTAKYGSFSQFVTKISVKEATLTGGSSISYDVYTKQSAITPARVRMKILLEAEHKEYIPAGWPACRGPVVKNTMKIIVDAPESEQLPASFVLWSKDE